MAENLIMNPGEGKDGLCERKDVLCERKDVLFRLVGGFRYDCAEDHYEERWDLILRHDGSTATADV